MAFRNEPQFRDVDSGENQIRRYVHQPISIDHYGIHASILSNGKIIIQKVARVQGEEVEYDEVEIPASLVFKLASLLKATRKTEYVSVSPRADEARNEKDEPEKV